MKCIYLSELVVPFIFLVVNNQSPDISNSETRVSTRESPQAVRLRQSRNWSWISRIILSTPCLSKSYSQRSPRVEWTRTLAKCPTKPPHRISLKSKVVSLVQESLTPYFFITHKSEGSIEWSSHLQTKHKHPPIWFWCIHGTLSFPAWRWWTVPQEWIIMELRYDFVLIFIDCLIVFLWSVSYSYK